MIEKALIERLSIPVFHDDQHGTAIVTAAGLLNALELQGKELKKIRVVCLGAGAAGLATMRLFLTLGIPKENLLIVDRRGVIHEDRTDLNEFKQQFAIKTKLRTLSDALLGADVFIGVSGPETVSKEMIKSMANKPIIFALSNPVPEISPKDIKAVRNDAIIATGQ